MKRESSVYVVEQATTKKSTSSPATTIYPLVAVAAVVITLTNGKQTNDHFNLVR